MFSRFFCVTQDHRIGLGKTLHTFDQLWKIGRVLWLDGTTHNWRHRELHGNNTVSIFLGTDGSGLQEVLVNADECASVSSWDVGHLFSVASHHDNSTLDVLDPEFRLLSCDVVRTHDTDLLSSGNLSGEHTAKSIETSLIRGWNHLRNVHTQWSTIRSIAGTDSSGGLVIQGSVVKSVYTVRLSYRWGWKLAHNHLQDGISSWEPLLHDTFQELF
mmetsp:Transcript_35561/g.54694  ORF Transcript_35561/g.54694 Transcript_35561/m.54694 type:complete len:215 (-) Transcript_35561:1057-1701(-)